MSSHTKVILLTGAMLLLLIAPPTYSKVMLYPRDNAIENAISYQAYDVLLLNTEKTDSGFKLAVRDGFGKLDEKFAMLTPKEATKLWGEPHNFGTKKHFETYDVYSRYCKVEENIHHIDCFFSDEKRLCQYRVRGIGISHPRWISVNGFVEPSRSLNTVDIVPTKP